MENIPREISESLEALLMLLAPDSHATADSQSVAARTVSTCSSTSNGNSAFEIRRSARRLDRALQSLESALEQSNEEMTIGPLLQSDLVAILTSLGQALDNQPSVDWRSHDVLQLYQDLVITATRILVMNDSFVLHQDKQLDALVDRIALLLIQQDSSDKVLNALVTCVNAHLVHTEEATTEQPILFPLLQGLETIQLVKIVIDKCTHDMQRRWNPNEENDRFDLWNFCTFLLKHLAGCRGDNDVLGWLQNRFMEDEHARERYTTPQVLLQDVNGFLDSCRTFGVELMEFALEVLDQASMETTVMDHSQVAVQQTWLVYSTALVIERGLQVALPFPMLRSLFTAYASFVAVFTHNFVEQQGDDTRLIACELLVDLANLVLQNPQSRGANVCDSAMETAVSITVLCALDTCGIKQEMTPILEYMRDQGQSSSEWPTTKKPRQGDGHDVSSTKSTEDSGLFTDILQASIMASLMLPISSTDATQSRDSVARLVQSFPTTKDPWHSLVARKVKESFGFGAPIGQVVDGDSEVASSVAWGDQTLQRYILEHQKKPPVVTQEESETGDHNET